MAIESKTDKAPGNVNTPDPNQTNAIAKTAEKAPATLAVYTVLHAMVGPFSEGQIVSEADLQGPENTRRLILSGAVTL